MSDPWAPPPSSWSPGITPSLPPRRGLQWWMPVVAFGVVAVLVGGGFAVVDLARSGGQPASTAGARGGRPQTISGPSAPLPAAVSSTAPAGSPSVVTPTMARAILDAVWPLRESAMSQGNLGVLRQLESGSALAGDTVRVGCGCKVRESPAPMTDSLIFVSRQTAYPATFMAHVLTTASGGNPYVQYFVFRRTAAGSSWQIVFETGAEYPSSPSLSQPDVATDGYTREPTTAQRAHLASVPGLIAAYWTQAKDTGRSDGAMGPLEPGYWTDQKAVRLAAHRNGAVQSNGLIGKFRYWVDPKDPVFVSRAKGEAFACALIHRRAAYTHHGLMYPYQDSARDDWGPGVAPGRYREIDTAGVAETCYFEPDQAHGLDVDVIGGDELVESASTGVR
jgi:hypothetical protein